MFSFPTCLKCLPSELTVFQSLEPMGSLHYFLLQEASQAVPNQAVPIPPNLPEGPSSEHFATLATTSLTPIYPEAGRVILMKAKGSPLSLEPLVDTKKGHKPSVPWNLLTTLHIPAPANYGPPNLAKVGRSCKGSAPFPSSNL